jgi:hypothetical protein
MGEKSRTKKIIIHQSRCRLRELRNLNMGIDLPYNLHTLQLATMQ